MDAYEGIFTMLDDLGMPDIKEVFHRHRIQDITLRYMETEEELRKLLKEIEIPLGQCIPITKSWAKWRLRENDITNDNTSLSYKVPMTHCAIQATVPTADISTQTFNDNNAYQHHPPGVIGSGYIHPPTATFGQYSQSLIDQMNNIAFTNHINPAIPSTNGGPGYIHHMPTAPQIYEHQQMWGANYNYPPVNEDLGRSGWLGMLSSGPTITSASREMSPISSPSLQDPLIQGNDNHNDVVDEHEDMVIERSLVAEEKQQSYAAALKEKQMASAAKAPESKEARPRSSSVPYPSPPPLTSPPANASYTNASSFTKIHTSIRPKDVPSTFTQCDEISVESGTSGIVGNNLKDIGSPSLMRYLEKLMASQEYIEATSKSKADLQKGWLPIDGKHILSARKIQFKPMFIDDKGRMRHGVSVRGADKSEECSRHTVGKAPAYCTFAHSRIGDTLQFICIKCSCEKSRYTYCQDKKDHREYIFNLGPYKNIHGEPWKLLT